MWYFTTQRDQSLKHLLKHYGTQKEMGSMIFNVIRAVEHLHSLGLVHRALKPDVIFQSDDQRRPLFIASHEYTTQISCRDVNFNLPDNMYQIKSKQWRAGSKKQDLCALGGIIMAWQVSVEVYEKIMRNSKNRMKNVQEFVKD